MLGTTTRSAAGVREPRYRRVARQAIQPLAVARGFSRFNVEVRRALDHKPQCSVRAGQSCKRLHERMNALDLLDAAYVDDHELVGPEAELPPPSRTVQAGAAEVIDVDAIRHSDGAFRRGAGRHPLLDHVPRGEDERGDASRRARLPVRQLHPVRRRVVRVEGERRASEPREQRRCREQVDAMAVHHVRAQAPKSCEARGCGYR